MGFYERKLNIQVINKLNIQVINNTKANQSTDSGLHMLTSGLYE